MKYANWVVLLLTVWGGMAHGQPIVPRVNPYKQVAYVGIGFDQALIMTTIGYGRALGVSRRSLLLTAEVSLPPTSYGLHNRRYRVGGRLNLVEADRFALSLSLESSLSYARNQTYEALNYASALSLTPALLVGRWTAGIEGYYNHGWTTRLTNRLLYRANYSAVQDGWYKNPSGTLRGGIALGYQWGPHQLTLRLGYQRNGQYDTYLPPYYGSLGFSQRFSRQ